MAQTGARERAFTPLLASPTAWGRNQKRRALQRCREPSPLKAKGAGANGANQNAGTRQATRRVAQPAPCLPRRGGGGTRNAVLCDDAGNQQRGRQSGAERMAQTRTQERSPWQAKWAERTTQIRTQERAFTPLLTSPTAWGRDQKRRALKRCREPSPLKAKRGGSEWRKQ